MVSQLSTEEFQASSHMSASRNVVTELGTYLQMCYRKADAIRAKDNQPSSHVWPPHEFAYHGNIAPAVVGKGPGWRGLFAGVIEHQLPVEAPDLQ